MAVAVPIVSKKSVSMNVKIVSSAVIAPRSNTLVRSTSNSVSNFGAGNVLGQSLTPKTMASTAVTRIVITSAPFTLRTNSTMAMSNPSSVIAAEAVSGKTNDTGVPPPPTMRPPLTNPMNRMNKPMPTAIASLRLFGTAFMTASRKPARTRIVTRMPSSTMTPMAPCGVRPLPITNWNATAALMPSPVAIAIG